MKKGDKNLLAYFTGIPILNEAYRMISIIKMYKEAILLAFLVVLGQLTGINPCPPGQISADGKCQPVNCKGNDNCPNGYMCSNGQCVDRCISILCLFGYDCIGGRCIKRQGTCPCPKGQICNQDNLCVSKNFCQTCKKDEICVKQSKCFPLPEVQNCPVDAQVNVQYCTQRPTLDECPLIYYIREPDPLYCGVYPDGSRVNFPVECEACRDKNVLYYYDVPCHQAPFVCEEEREQCLGYYCGNQDCTVDDDCPYDWQICAQGSCIDRCALMKCAEECKFGKCGYQATTGDCTSNLDCSKQERCYGGKCQDVCSVTACLSGQICERGNCVVN